MIRQKNVTRLVNIAYQIASVACRNLGIASHKMSDAVVSNDM